MSICGEKGKVTPEQRERLSALLHEIWNKWAIYMLENYNDDSIVRWKKQTMTAYEDLTEKERWSDRREVDRILQLMRDMGIIE